jgi:hypothetical protein
MPGKTANIDHLTYQQLDESHLRVSRRDGKDGIGWDELQSVKNEVFGEEATCVEVYPPEGEVVNDANIRHLWLVPPGTFIPSLQRRTQWGDR